MSFQVHNFVQSLWAQKHHATKSLKGTKPSYQERFLQMFWEVISFELF
jgi:hypothetical protein